MPSVASVSSPINHCSASGSLSREICKICYHANPVGFSVPDGVWECIVPPELRESVVCLACFARIGDEKGVQWDREIEFFPVSRATHLSPG